VQLVCTGGMSPADHKTTAMVLLGLLWPALFIAFTLYSSWVALGWSFIEEVGSKAIAACCQGDHLVRFGPIVRSRLSIRYVRMGPPEVQGGRRHPIRRVPGPSSTDLRASGWLGGSIKRAITGIVVVAGD